MKKIIKFRRILFYYGYAFTSLLILSGLFLGFSRNYWSLFLLLFFVFLYFLTKKIKGIKKIKLFLSIYALFTLIFISITNLATATSYYQIILGLTFIPVALYFWLELIDKWLGSYLKKISRSQKAIILPAKQSPAVTNQVNNYTNITQVNRPTGFQISDENRRQFLKLIGGTSLGFVVMSLLNPKSASATFFGSVPGPGTVSLKDASGTKINPAEKQPTDGYKISQVDDSTTPAYYGFINSDGAWYIMQEGSDGSYLYTRGSTGFSSNWGTKELLSYDYFHEIF